MRDVPEKVLLRPAMPDDDQFLFELYVDGRTAELRTLGWDERQIAAFCELQYRALNWDHSARFSEAEDQIITLNEVAIGRLKVVEYETELLLVDIAILSNHQNQGFGSFLLHELMRRADDQLKPLRLHLLTTNPVIELYERLGFSRVRDNSAYIEMEYQPGTSGSRAKIN
jgi:ribosomal protein S18 acetylase RimI-like enzyme